VDSKPGGLVKEKDLRVLNQSTGNGNSLLLATGKVLTPGLNKGVETLWQLGDEIVGIGELAGPDDLLHGGVFLSQGDIFGDGAHKENWLLTHVTNLP
jgi:hypothetical protein